MTEEEIKAEIRRLAPFFHRVDLPHGLSTYVPELAKREVESTRVSGLVEHAFPALLDACGGSFRGLRVLDLACNCGGFSVEAAKAGADYVLGVDSTDHYIEQASFIKRALGMGQLEFRKMDIAHLEAETVGEFDVTICFGILYNLENPIAVMKRVSAITRQLMLVETGMLPPHPEGADERRALWRMHIPKGPPRARGVGTNLWRKRDALVRLIPNKQAVIELLDLLGFSQVEELVPTDESLMVPYRKGKRSTFLARRDEPEAR